MSALVFRLRHEPGQRLDLSPLQPGRLGGLAAKAIAAIRIESGRQPICVGDIFRIRSGDASEIRFEGGSERLDNIGAGLDGGSIIVDGDVGCRVGRRMKDGMISVRGDAGPWAASGLAGGRLTIDGRAGDFLAGPMPGEMTGMRGGLVHVRGSAGARAGDRLRRGTLVIDGNAGAYAGSRMIAGTVIISGRAGDLPGYLMRRGTIVLGMEPESMSPAFVESGRHDLVFTRLLARALDEQGIAVRCLSHRPLCRFGGDTAVLGKGEILLAAATRVSYGRHGPERN